MKRKIKLLIDGDILVYRCGFACQKKGQEIEPIGHALHLVKKAIKEMREYFLSDNVKIFLTSDDHSNFRYALAKTQPYKGNRDKTVNPNAAGRPEHYGAIREYLIKQYNTVVVSDIEADDALGIAQYSLFANSEWEPVICSIDKDLDMIVGRHFNFVKNIEYVVEDPGKLEYDKDKKKLSGGGLFWFYAQLLLGDQSDNIPGLKGYGPVKVFNTLNKCKDERELWIEVQKSYELKLEDTNSMEEIESRLYEVVDLLWIWRKEGDCKSTFLRGLS